MTKHENKPRQTKQGAGESKQCLTDGVNRKIKDAKSNPNKTRETDSLRRVEHAKAFLAQVTLPSTDSIQWE